MKKGFTIALSALLLTVGATSIYAKPGMMRNGGNMGMNMGMNGNCPQMQMTMQDQLNLTDKQQEQLDALRVKFFEKNSIERRKLMTLERQLNAEMLKSTPDQAQINKLTDQIGKQYGELLRLKSAHSADVAALLTPAQREAMKGLTNARPMCNGAGRAMMMCP